MAGEAAEAVDRGDEILEPTPAPEPEPEAKPEPEPEPEGEEETPAAASGETDDDDSKEPRIPKARFDEAVRRERERAQQLEAELKTYQTREQQRETASNLEESMAKVKELVKSHTSLLADGDLDKASGVMEEILSLHADMADARVQAASQTTRSSVKEEMRYDAAVSRIEAEYPMLNPDNPDFDRDTTRRVQALMTGIMQTERKDPATALTEAAEVLLASTKKEQQSLREQPSPAAVDTGMRRKADAVNKAVEANEKQPASTSDVGKDHDTQGGALDAASIMKMSSEEFANLPEETLSKFRGDYID